MWRHGNRNGLCLEARQVLLCMSMLSTYLVGIAWGLWRNLYEKKNVNFDKGVNVQRHLNTVNFITVSRVIVVVSNTLKDFMGDIIEEKNGFKFGEPWRFSEKSLGVVVPILREKEVTRDYITQQETKEEIKITDQGNIERLKVKSDSDKNVFIRAGTIFKGDTQERGVTASIIVEPHSEEIEVPVKCVHASKGIQTGTSMSSAGFAPHSITANFLDNSDQRTVWNNINKYAQRQTKHIRRLRQGPITEEQGHSSFVGSMLALDDDLLQNMEKVETFKESVDDMLKKVPAFENQSGAIIFDFKGILGVETFDSSKSWEAIHEEIIKKYSDSISQEQAEPIFELKKDMIEKKIREFFEKLVAFEEKTIAMQHNSETKSVYGNGVIGEYTVLNNKVIHFLAMRKDS